MSMNKKDYVMLASAMAETLDPPNRIRLFNRLVPELKQANSNFSVLVFLTHCFPGDVGVKLTADGPFGVGRVEEIKGEG